MVISNIHNRTMITDVVLLNPYHIGDVLFNQKIVYYFCKSNPSYKIRVCIHRGHFLLSDIPGIEYDTNTTLMRGFTRGKRSLFRRGTLFLNMWIFAINRTTSEIECNYQRVYEGFRTMLTEINARYCTQFQMPDVSTINPIYTLPYTNIDPFLTWKEHHTDKQLVLYMNYMPQSGQPIPITSHDDVIKRLSSAHRDTIFLIANLSDTLKHYVSDNSITNLVDCVSEFDCTETESCENICKINHIMRACDYAVVFDIGACFTYADDKLFDYPHTVLHVATASFFYNCISESFNKDIFNTKVRLTLATDQESVIRTLSDIFATKKIHSI